LTLIESHLQEQGILTFRQDSNLLVHFQGKNREKAFIFDGHVDTVSADEEAWSPLDLDKFFIGQLKQYHKSYFRTSLISRNSCRFG